MDWKTLIAGIAIGMVVERVMYNIFTKWWIRLPPKKEEEIKLYKVK